MANSQRDERGRFSSGSSAPNGGGAGVNPAADPAPRGPAANIADLPTATRPGTGGMQAAASIAHDDDWGNLSTATNALVNRPAGGPGSGMGDFAGADKPEIRDFGEGFEKLDFGGPDLAKEAVKAGTVNRTSQAAGRSAYDASMRAAGYGGNESAGQHTVSAPGGRAGHGSDIDPGGIPGPGDYDDGDDWGGGAPGGGLGGPRDWSQGI